MTLFPIAMLIAHAWGPLISLAIAIAVIVFRYEPPEWNPVVLGVTYFVAILVVILLAGWMASSPSVERLVVAILLPALGYIVGFAKSLFVNP